MQLSYSQLLTQSLLKLKKKSNPLDIQLLIEAAFNITREQFWINKHKKILNKTAIRRFYKYLARLNNEEPIAYILKKKEFYGESFYINKNVLIPRPDTEILVEKAIEIINKPIRILDIGAGSGNISILLAKKTGSKITAVEKCQKALRVLKKNINSHQLSDLIIPVCANLFPKTEDKFDMIVSNPPYISNAEWRQLEPNVKYYEPKGALIADNNGLEIISQIVTGAKDYLKLGGKLLIEIGYAQQEAVKDILKKSLFSNIYFIKDYSGIPRVAMAHFL